MMSTAQETEGLVYSTPAVNIFDTRAMEWSDFPARKGAKVKVLARFESGDPEIFLLWMPPGPLRVLRGGKQYRHYHQTVHEHSFILHGGPLPHWDYDSPEQKVGTLINFGPGYYLDRRPGPDGIHGAEFGAVPQVGRVSLSWRSGTGNWADEPNFHDESLEIPYPEGPGVPAAPPVSPDDPPGIVYRRPSVTVFNTFEMGWEEYPGLDGTKIKVLERFPDGEPSVMLRWRQPGALLPPDRLPYRHYHATVRECMFVLQGEIPHWDYRSADDAEGEGKLIRFKEGYFMDRRPGPGAIHGIEAGPVSDTGSLVLFWRTGTGNFVNEPNFKQESIEVPYP
jgi:hypothetical protein